ncbi:MAG: OmpA family protein [Bdellovibrionota bacterium]
MNKQFHNFLIFFSIFMYFFSSQALLAVNVQQFSRSNSLVFEMLEDSRMENSHVYSDYDAIFTIGGSWVDNPFVLKSSSNSSVTGEPLPNMKTIHLGAGVYVNPWLMLGITGGYSFFNWKTLNSSSETVDSGSSSAFNDIEVKAKFRLLREATWAVSIMPLATIPTGGGAFDPVSTDQYGKNKFLSDNGAGYGAKLLAEYLFSFMQVVANIGFKYNKEAEYSPDLNYSKMLYTGIGTYLPITDKLGANIEYVRQWKLPFSSDQNPNETYLGLSAGITRRVHAFAGLGLGNLFSSNDGNDWRISAGIKLIPLLWGDEQKPITKVNRKAIEIAVEEGISPEKALPEINSQENYNTDKTQYIFNNKSNTAVVHFPNNSGVLSVSSELEEVVLHLAQKKELIKKITVEGHASLVGNPSLNMHISKWRALTVKSYLVSKGIPPSIINIKAKGDTEPLINSKSFEANVANRRVEFLVEPR